MMTHNERCRVLSSSRLGNELENELEKLWPETRFGREEGKNFFNLDEWFH